MTKNKYDRQTSHSRPWCVRLTPEIMAYLSAPTKYGDTIDRGIEAECISLPSAQCRGNDNRL